jgi:hypothetical protein
LSPSAAADRPHFGGTLPVAAEADSSIWIDHLHASEPALVDLLSLDQAGCHSLIIQEIGRDGRGVVQ